MEFTDKHLSIILAAYNHEKTVKRCIESVIAQENADLQMECIVVDDCSTDKTLDIVRSIVRNYSGSITFRMFRHKVHRGMSAVRNTGLRQAQGGYVMFLCGSDYLSPDCVDYFTGNLMRYWDMDVIIGNIHCNRHAQTLLRELSGPVALRGDGRLMCQQMISHDFFLFAWNKLVRRELLVEKGIVFDESLAFSDLLWNYTLFTRTSAVLLLPNLTYVHEDPDDVSIWSAEKRANQLVQSYVVTADKILDSAPRPQQTDTNDFYLYHQLFIFSLLKGGEELQKEFDVSSQLRREQANVRKRLASLTRNDGQKTLALYLSSSGSAMGSILRLPVFRRYDSLVDHIVHMLQTNIR